MTTLTFRIQVNEQTGKRIKQSRQERKKINFLLKSIVESSSMQLKKEALLSSINDLSEEAKQNGLTDTQLVHLLEEIDSERD